MAACTRAESEINGSFRDQRASTDLSVGQVAVFGLPGQHGEVTVGACSDTVCRIDRPSIDLPLIFLVSED